MAARHVEDRQAPRPASLGPARREEADEPADEEVGEGEEDGEAEVVGRRVVELADLLDESPVRRGLALVERMHPHGRHGDLDNTRLHLRLAASIKGAAALASMRPDLRS